MKETNSFPIEFDFQPLQEGIYGLENIEEDVILPKSSGAALFGVIESLGKVHLEGLFIIEIDNDQQQEKRSEKASDVGESIDDLLVGSSDY
jgi:hypothetical protein